MDDWVHGDEGTTQWNEVMARENMIVGGPALRLDTTVLSSMRPHRAAAPPVGVPVVKLFAVVGLAGAAYDPSNDQARFGSLPLDVGTDPSQNEVQTRFAPALASPKKQRREVIGSARSGGQPGTAMNNHPVGSVMCPGISCARAAPSPLLVTAFNDRDIALSIMLCLDPADLGSSRFVCKTWKVIIASAASVRVEPQTRTGGLAQGASALLSGSPESFFDHGMPFRCVREEANDERDRIQRMGTIPALEADFDITLDKFRDQIKFAQGECARFAQDIAAEKRSDRLIGWTSPPSMARGNACVGVTDDEVVSVGSDGADLSPANAAPNFDGFPVSPHSFQALMSTDVGTGGVTDPATSRERVQAMAAGKHEVDRKSLRKEHAGDGWATPPPVVRVTSPSSGSTT